MPARHTVSPSSPEAALEAPLPGLSGLTLTDIQTAIQEARGRAEHATIARIEGVTEQLSGITPFGRCASPSSVSLH